MDRFFWGLACNAAAAGNQLAQNTVGVYNDLAPKAVATYNDLSPHAVAAGHQLALNTVSTYNDLLPKVIAGTYGLALNANDFVAWKVQPEITGLEGRLPEGVVATLKSWWNNWQQNFPEPVRWMVYGVMVGLAAYAVLGAVGFAASGVRIGSLAATIQSTLGDVTQGSVFAALQSLGTANLLNFASVGGAAGGVVGLVKAALEDMEKASRTPESRLVEA